MGTITFQDIIVPAFKFALAMGTGFRHRNCFTPNNITSGSCSKNGGVESGPMKQDKTNYLFSEGYKICVSMAGLLTYPGS